ncbi:dockerin type I repeat-containing protein [Porcipelethomonas sp.]|uniref:dockerin type I repeat-containing protein n=1 Tax=Porcipelethomonas sp. TaxID=2981675 RepID=UPI003EF71B8D
MKLVKRFFSGITAAAIFLTGAVFSEVNNNFENTYVSAEESLVYTPINRSSSGTEQLSITDAEGMPGDTVRVYLSAVSEDNLESMDVILGWNDKNLLCSNAEGTDAYGSRVVTDIYDGFLSVCAYSTLAIADGHVAAIDFTIPEDAKPGTVYNIDFVRIDTIATVDRDVTNTAGISGGTITVPKTEQLSETELDLIVGESKTLTVDDYSEEIKWISDNTDIATVKDGCVTAVSEGTAVIYAVIGYKVLICNVNVSNEKVTTATTVTLPPETSTEVSSAATTVSADLTSTSDTYAVSLVSTETSVTSDTDITTETSQSETTDTTSAAETVPASSETNISTEITYTSAETTTTNTTQTSSESSEKKKITMYVGDKLRLRVQGYDGEVKWVSANSKVVTVDSNGNIEAVGKGNTTVLALFEDKYIICAVEVLEKKMFSSGVCGDADGNGVVNIRDAAVIANKISKGEGSQLPDCADYNMDGVVNIRDAAAIARSIAQRYIIIQIIIKTQ